MSLFFKNNTFKTLLSMALLFLFSSQTFAWGKRGHFMVGEAASYLIADVSKAPFCKERSFDLGYLNNVPDIVWKNHEDIYKIEAKEHFVDLEAFSEVKDSDWHEPWAKDRKEFFKKYPKISENQGRAYWRIVELEDGLKKLAIDLRDKKIKGLKHQELQQRWISQAGVLGHYVADLGQPLHVTTNYDGQLSEQKGIHSFFETEVVDALYPEIVAEVHKRAKELYSQNEKSNHSKSTWELILKLAKDSNEKKTEVLTIDKKVGRSDLQKASQAYKEIIIDGLARSTVVLAEIWSRELDWEYDGKQFFSFDHNPEYRYPAGSHEEF